MRWRSGEERETEEDVVKGGWGGKCEGWIEKGIGL